MVETYAAEAPHQEWYPGRNNTRTHTTPVADKQVAESAVWRMDPEVAQEFA